MDEIVGRILASAKYKDLYPATVERIVADAYVRDPKHAEDLARRKLHQIWGAYWRGRGALQDLGESVASVNSVEDREQWLVKALDIHASSWERSDADFYKKIWQVVGHTPHSVVDYGCGFAPLLYDSMDLLSDSRYVGVDIDEKEITFLRQVATIWQWGQVDFKVGDILCGDFVVSEVALCLKLFPVLEQQHKGVVRDLLLKIPSDYIVVSFPCSSLGGRKQKMGEFYGEWLVGLVDELGLQRNKVESITVEEVWVVGR